MNYHSHNTEQTIKTFDSSSHISWLKNSLRDPLESSPSRQFNIENKSTICFRKKGTLFFLC